MYKIGIFWHPEVQRGRGRCPSRGAFAPAFRSYRRLPAQHGEVNGMDGGRRDGLPEDLLNRVGGYREGRQSEARRLHEYGIHGLPQVWIGESSGV
jgi:hypothetical protein